MSTLKPVYLLAGGRLILRETTSTLLHHIFKEIGIASPRVAYVGSANQDTETFYQRTADLLKAAGALTVNHALISPEGANIEKAQEILASAHIVFISGGDVFEGIKTLKEKNMISFLRGLYEKGKPFMGISAGSIMLAETWVRWNNSDDDSTAELFPCLGFAPVICDTHDEDNDWEELKMALKLSKEEQKGYGIVSGTAIKVSSNSTIETLNGVTHQFIQREGRISRLPDILPTPSRLAG